MGRSVSAGGPRWEPTSPRSSMSTTQKIRSIGREARVNQLISERLEHWKAAMRERGASTITKIWARPVMSEIMGA